MVLKRKRSESELSFSSAFSSPTRPGSSTFDFNTMETGSWGFLALRSSTPSHLPSRTMKRFRDNRPSEAEVHQRTLNLLYSAQQHRLPSITQPQPTVISTLSQKEIPPRRDVQQRSLHSFWRLPVIAGSSVPSITQSVALSPPVTNQSFSMCCEDCGAGPSDGSDMMMDMEGGGTDNQSCGACGKIVCFSCSISNLGEHRRCLVCAEPRVWAGGLRLTTGVTC